MNSHIDPSGHEEIFTDADHHRAISWDALPPHEVLFEHLNPSTPPPSAVISQDEGSFQELRISRIERSSKLKKLSEIFTGEALNKKQHSWLTHKNPYSITETWSLLPPMIEERSRCAAVSIPDYSVLFIGGIGRDGFLLRSTELLTRRFGKGRGRVYVVGWGEYVESMEKLEVEVGSQWTFLISFGLSQRLEIYSMARVGNKLIVLFIGTSALYTVELDGDPKTGSPATEFNQSFDDERTRPLPRRALPTSSASAPIVLALA
ncbi:unnamed protein product [Hymenolepis diminuta]|uniref:DUF2235 domain-containing protein n=1 Tax=Hymenolepis diminuta TaxID=6216 RepID=A0A0R3SEZ6_HYMDI|nr:unnamed protein product [Hymenolepis diminuta]